MPWLLEFVKIAMPMCEPDAEHIERMLVLHIDKHVVLVAEEDGKLKGTIIGCYMPHFLNPKLSMLQELAWWVPKEYRGEGIGGPLLEAFASIRKTDVTVMTLRPETKGLQAKYEEQGFQLYEYAYVRGNR